MSFTAPGGGQVVLELSAGAVDQPMTLQVTLLAAPTNLPTTLRFAGQTFAIDAYRLGSQSEGLRFQEPVTLTLTYTDADVAGLDEATLLFYFFDPATATWQTDGVVVTERRPEHNQLVIALSHLTDFALFATEITPTANKWQIYLPVVRNAAEADPLP